MKIKKVRVNDNMQSDYEYTLVAPMGKKFDSRFSPEVTPKQMLALGVFGGVYLRGTRKQTSQAGERLISISRRK
jgi:hypothetical protein